MIKPKLVRLPNGMWIDPNSVVCIESLFNENHNLWNIVIRIEVGEDICVRFCQEENAEDFMEQAADLINQARI